MAPTYWIDLFTIETWAEARKFDLSQSGFRQARESIARKVAVGDVLVCYLGGGVSRWVGALEVMSGPTITGEPRIWAGDPFPVRFATKPLVALDPEFGIPVADLAPRLEMFRQLKDQRNYGWMFQGSPARLRFQDDGETIVAALRAAEATPTRRPIEAKRTRRATTDDSFMATTGDVVVPEEDPLPRAEERAHTEMQYLLLKLGCDLGLDVWVARNDRSRASNGKRFQDLPRLKQELPEQFDRDTQRIVELIDVLWIERGGIRCAFEIENSTNIYGGLLRMSDLLSRRPNLDIPLYIVAPDDRQRKVVQELNRPTFVQMAKPLVEVCKFISYSALRENLSRWADHVSYLKPDVIDGIAVSCRID